MILAAETAWLGLHVIDWAVLSVYFVVVVAIGVWSYKRVKDMTDFFKEMMEDGEMPEGLDMEMEVHSADNEYEFEGEGLLLWNLEAGHVYSFELRGSGTTTMDMAMAMTMQGNDMDFEQMIVMSSDETITITTSSGE